MAGELPRGLDPRILSRARDLFERLLERDERERSDLLERECDGDPSLLALVLAMIDADAEGEALEPPSREYPTAAGPPSSSPAPPRTIAGFTLGRCIGSGGSGIVYEAIQETPHRKVALKLLRLDAATPKATDRFLLEAELLARLRHPSIGTVLEAGVHRKTDTEIPWLALELVEDARDVLSHAREEGLDLEARIQLLLQACDAVQHGHEKGVIHRDLKPTNLLVDRAGRLRVIDFGIARPLDGISTRRTEEGTLLGTLPYMSPERLALGGDAAGDVRSDVYSLGVVLYELVCGRPPHDLAGKSLTEVAHVISERPPRSPRSLVASLPRDLECVLLRALSTDPSERYPSAEELAAELRRFLAGEEVHAAPPSLTDRIRRIVRRHRVAVGLSTALVLAVVAGLVGTTMGWIEAHRQERTARDEARRSTALRDVLRTLVILASPQYEGPEVKLVDALDRVAADVEPTFADQPDLLVSALRDVGHVYIDIGQWEKALPLLERAAAVAESGPSLELAQTLNVRGLALQSLGRVGEALESYERAVTAFRASGCSEESSALLDARENVALALSSLGRREEAEAILRSIIETRRRAFGPLDVATLKVMGKLSDCLAGDGQLDEACRMGTEVVESLRRALGDRDPLTLNRMHNHAFLLGNRHRYGEALSLERTVLDTWPGLLGEGHPHILSARQAEGIYALASGNAPLAVDCFRAVHDHPSHASANSRQRVIRDLLLGTALLESGQNDEARELLNGSADAAPEVLAPDDPWRLLGVAARGRILFLDGDARGNDSLRAARKSLAGSLPEADWRLRLATRWEEAGGG